MIVLDTNALIGSGFGPSVLATMLRALAGETGHPLAIPQEVLEEYLAKYERDVTAALEAGESEKLLSLVPHWAGRSDLARDLDTPALPILRSAINERREALTKRLSTRFAVLETPTGAVEEGIARERSRRLPASRDGHEARDVVVWLTVLKTAESTPPSNVYFVSSDRGFTGENPRHLHPELRYEAPSNLKFFPSVQALIHRLSCGAEPAAGIAASPEVLEAIEQTAIRGGCDPNHDLRRDIWGWKPEGVSFSDIVSATPSLEFERSVAARACGDTTFTAVDAVYRLELRWGGGVAGPVIVTVRLGVLVTHDGDDLVGVRVLARSGIRSSESQPGEGTDGPE